MQSEIPYFTRDVINHFRTMQDREYIRRTVTGEYEPVNFPPNSSFRFWVNKELRNYEKHWHASTEIIVPIENHMTVHVKQQEYILNPGEIFIIPDGELHDLICSEPGVRLVFLFNLSALQTISGFPYLASTFSHPVLIRPTDAIYHKEMELLYRMLEDYYRQSSLRELMILSKMITFHVEYEENHPFLNSSIPKQYEKSVIDRLNMVFFYINQHYTEDIPLEKAAEIAGFSKYHFARVFKEFSGQTFFDYLCLQRIKSAERLLLVPDKAITDIAYQAGFGSICAFNRAFKKKNHCTPSEYRTKRTED
ncbi:MAG: helix-turn-helix transcriptional regulator [Lachnospiraceae bacterium]|nr:helix-turn-helix transcriptional regulator [Lachnospiraceae bacterium]